MASKQLVPSSCGQLRIRTNIAIPKPINFYVSENDDSVPYVFALSAHTILTATGCEEALLSGYLSALCAILPDLTSISKMAMKHLCMQAEEIMIPSQAAKMNIAIPQSNDLKLEALRFAQMCFSLLKNNVYYSDNTVASFWNDRQREGLQRAVASSLKALLATSTPLGQVINATISRNQLGQGYIYGNLAIYATDVHA